MCLDDLIAKARTIGNEDFQFLFTLFLLLVEKLIITVQTGFALCLACLGRHTYPLQLALQRLAALACHLLLLLHALRFLLKPGRIVALPRNTLTAVEFENPACHIVEEVTVVCYCNNCAFVLSKVLLQPVNAFCIKVVGRLVEQQYIRLLQQQATKCHTTAFATTQRFDLLVGTWTTKRIHSTFQFAIQVPCIGAVDDVLQLALTGKELIHLVFVLIVFRKTKLLIDFLIFSQCINDVLHAFLHHFDDCFLVIKFRLLLKITDTIARTPYYISLILLLNAGNNLHER